MKFKMAYLPVYALIATLFLENFIYQYIALIGFVLAYLLRRPAIKLSFLLILPFVFLLFALLSFVYNLYTGLADRYSLIFWIISYAPPVILMWIALVYRASIDFFSAYSFYKKLVYIQSFFLIASAIQYKTLVVGDAATGTVGDANWVAYHICVVLIFEVVRVITWTKTDGIVFRNRFLSLAEIFYFLIVLIIPESTANLGFILIVMAILFLNEYVLARINPQNVIIFLVCSALAFAIIKDTFVFRRIEDTARGLAAKNVEYDYNFFKLNMYRKIVSGEIYKDVSPLVGSGPATFTSRSSVVRMPEERANDVAIDLPYFKNEIFARYISPAYADWRKSGESYGNFASPQTTIISIAVELGLVGLALFALYFYAIWRKFDHRNCSNEYLHVLKFGKYYTLFFVMSLFHMNFWEYPIICFTYILFVSLIIRQKPDFQHDALTAAGAQQWS